MMSRPQFHPETLVRNINMRTYIDRLGYRYAKERAWMDIVGLMYEELEYYISAPGTPDDILHELKPKARRMKVDTLSGGYRVGYIKGGMIADIFEEKDSLYVTFSETGQYIYMNQSWDLSYSGSDNAAAFIAASLRAYRIIEDKFRNSCMAA